MAFTVPEDELRFRTTRGGGPGGQHVNKTSTRVEVFWNVAQSPSITDTQRGRLLRKLATRIDRRGVLRVAASARRSQLQNRLAAVERLNDLVRDALHMPRPRKRTKPPRASKEQRLAEKRRRGETKRQRQRVEPDD